jgi:AcrR family transcriptional regulator
MKRTPTPRDPDATRAALLAAGEGLFAERGFTGATIDRIARRAGVNKAMISYHFGGKTGLYEAIFSENLRRVLERLETVVEDDRPAGESLRALLDVLAETHVEHPRLSTILLREAITGGRHLSDEIFPLFLEVFRRVREILDHGFENGTFRAVDPLLTHVSLMGAVLFYFASAPFRERLLREGKLALPDAPTADRFVDHLKDLFSHGLAASSAPPGRVES